MLFPEGIQYDNTYRTENINFVFHTIAKLSSSYKGNAKDDSDFFIEKSPSVPGGGLEPPHLAAYAPQTYLSTNSNIRAKAILNLLKRDAKIRIYK